MNKIIPEGDVAQLFDVGSIAIIVAAIADMIPSVTAFVALVWLSMRVYKTWLEIGQLKRDEFHNRRKSDSS